MATFSISATARKAQTAGNGSAGPFSFSFQVNAQAEIDVFVDTTLKTLSTHYTVSVASNGTGTVSFTSGNFPTSSQVITILGDAPLSRTSVYTSGGNITAAALESDFDTNVMVQQQQQEVLSRTVKAPVDDASSVDMTLPNKDARKGKVLGFNATSGDPEAGPTITAVQSLSDVTASINLLGTAAVIEDMGLLSASAVIEDMGLLGASGNVSAMAKLGVDAVIADMAILGTDAIVADMAILGTDDVVADMAILGTSDVVTDMNLLATAAVVEDMGLLGTSANVSAMGHIGTSANVTAMGLLGTSAVVTDMGILGTAAIVEDMGILATSANVTAMGLLGVSGVITDMGLLGTAAVVEDMGLLATSAIIEDMGLLATSAVIEDMGLLATSAVIEDMGLLATSAAIEDMGILGTSANVTNMATLGASGVVGNIATVASNVAGVNAFAARYRVASSDPSSDNDEGDLFYNTSDNTFKFYNGSSYVAVNVSGIGNIVEDTSPQLGGNLDGQDKNITTTGVGTFASLDISGDIDVDGTTNLDAVDIDGAVYMATTLAVAGNVDFNGNLDVDGTANLDAIDVDGSANFAADVTFAVGADIITASTGNGQNVRVGADAGSSIASGGNQNVLLGDGAGATVSTGDGNTAIGFEAGNDISTGGYNTIMGWKAGDKISTGAQNTAIGDGAIGADTLGQKSVAVGSNTLNAQNFTTATDSYNVAMGYNAGQSLTVGVQNILIGGSAGDAMTDADGNIAIGFEAGNDITTGSYNTVVGWKAGDKINTASSNTGIGDGAIGAETKGAKSVAVGSNALNQQNFTTAVDAYNVAVGYNAGQGITTGVNNTLIGGLAGDALTGDSGYSGGANNVAVGRAALGADTLGSAAVAIGFETLLAQNFTTATDTCNTAVGYRAGKAVQDGKENTLIGGLCGDALTTGSYNTLLGQQTGKYTVGLTTGGDNVLIGAYCHTTAVDTSRAVVLGYHVQGATDYTTLGANTSDIRAAHGNVTWATVSDERYKKDIVDSTAGLSFINALQPRTFKYKTLGELPETFRAYEADSTEVFKNSNTNHGFIAQEVKAAIDADSSIKDGFRLWDDREDGSQEVAEAALIPILTKAVQELSTALDAALARIATLEG